MRNYKNYLIIMVIIIMTNINLYAEGIKVLVSKSSETAYLPVSQNSDYYGKDDGTIICWLEDRNSGSLRIQKIDYMGNFKWAENGVLVDSYIGTGFTSDSDYPLLFSDNKGGAIVIYRKVFFEREDIYAQKIDQYGNCFFAPVCLSSFYGGYNYSPSAVKTNSNNIAVTWENFSNGDFNIHAQMIDRNGSRLWNNGNEVVVCNVDYDQRKPAISCGKFNNIIISWLDGRNYTEYYFDLFANMLDSNGNTGIYEDKGKLIFRKVNPRNSRKDVFFYHNMVPSNNNSFITALEHSMDNQFSDVVLVKVNDNLEREWIVDLHSDFHQSKPLITSSENFGAGVIWNNETEGQNEIYGIIIDKEGRAIRGSGTGSRISCDDAKSPYSKILPSEKLSNGFYISGDRLYLNWVTTNTNRLFITDLYLADESAQCENTLEIQDDISEGEYTSITSHENYAVIVYKQAGSIFASLRNITGKGFTQTYEKPELENFPNPFNPSTNISFSIPSDGFVRLSVFDITGRLIRTLVSEFKTAGKYNVKFDGSSLASGVYFSRLEVNGAAHTKRITMLK
jgi:hypothetical protein